ncbi:MAG: nucleotidyl transferase AbiEii/AbiGii toxin family protein [Verrucomicrobiota bacterium]|nr:nucleotidyl transferase AbiEii/AbiGii toxin family protein [Verrucomicrobiota bacterium]
MSRREIKNMAASARSRLLEKSRNEGLAFNQVLQRYAMERFLYRLSVSEFADSFYLKGALLFWVWDLAERRTTMDIDLLGFMDNSLEGIEEAIRRICALDVSDDGLLFQTDSLRVQRIKEDADYEGVRVVFRAGLDTAVIAMQVDIGFGDRVGQGVDMCDFPVLLDMPVPRLKCYPVETVVAEKFEAMVKLELLNSRMKDFYDIWLLSRQHTFKMPGLLEACRATFRQRGTSCSLDNPLFGTEMKESETKQVQWSAFCRKSKLTTCPDTFAGLLDELFVFLLPLARAIDSNETVNGHWLPDGAWEFKPEKT